MQLLTTKTQHCRETSTRHLIKAATSLTSSNRKRKKLLYDNNHRRLENPYSPYAGQAWRMICHVEAAASTSASLHKNEMQPQRESLRKNRERLMKREVRLKPSVLFQRYSTSLASLKTYTEALLWYNYNLSCTPSMY